MRSIGKSYGRVVAPHCLDPYVYGMKTNKSFAMAMILFSIVASNAFALLRPPYPSKPSSPDSIVIIGEDRPDAVRSATRPLR